MCVLEDINKKGVYTAVDILLKKQKVIRNQSRQALKSLREASIIIERVSKNLDEYSISLERLKNGDINYEND